ncbi:aldehyde dehydrogenase family protein [Cupriavidus sp. P-10]|uniref:aldehyde dehydrogenase family protein n=1 Tax=Cupriavidus sp. P-10 TaxID=2027911 RepID=UPI000E2F352E|nr:aldehyde dehydrogenase family protein [Cupriavidus sp. P-10]BDB27274.1 aldehyde dehydrogenase family protein [Cupriavidus sp. P-10]
MNQLFINGNWTPAESGQSLDVIDPATGEVFATIARGAGVDVDRAVIAAQGALQGDWSRMTATERGRILSRIGELVLANIDELAQLESRDTGKPISTARNDIQVLARYFEFYGGAADKVHGEVIPFLHGYQALMSREPLGVTAHIIPWNYPAQMVGRSVAPALAMGNAAVLKPSEDACLTPLRIAALAAEAGLPAGAMNVVTGLGEEAGAALAAHPGIAFVTFTGSNEVGTLVQAAAARNHVKVALELGGKSPQVVFDDADLDRALPIIIKAIAQNAGQTCAAGSRLLLQDGIYEKFVAKVADAFGGIRVGLPANDRDCGPLINLSQLERVKGYIERAKRDGIPVLAEGRLDANLPEGGYYVTPVLFGPVAADNALANEEVFGPVLSVQRFSDEAEAIALANGTPYGLVAAVWTENGARQVRVAKAIRAGQVFVNCYGAGGGVELPFGGVKGSGHGREKGLLALEEMSSPKTIVQYHA